MLKWLKRLFVDQKMMKNDEFCHDFISMTVTMTMTSNIIQYLIMDGRNH